MTSTTPSPRIAPVEPPYDQELAETLARWMPPGAAVEPLHLFRTLAVHRELMDRMRPLGAALLSRHGTLQPRERELVIERVCARCGCSYEWGVHATAFGASLGLSEEQIRATATAPAADPLWSEREALLMGLVDELHERAAVSDELWAKLAAHWNAQQLLELLVLVGWYHLISFVAIGARVQPEAWARRLPSAE
jgi:alkylhydroperoxidase family enzyme